MRAWWAVGLSLLACQGINPEYAPPEELPKSVDPAAANEDQDPTEDDADSDPDDEEPEEPDPASGSEIALKIWLSEGGGVQVQPSGLECAAPCDTQFAAGTTVTLIPIPQPGFDFVGWDGPCVGNNGCILGPTERCSGLGNCVHTLDETTSVVGRFERRHFLRATLEGMGTVRSEVAGTGRQFLTCPGTCEVEFPEWSPVRLIATPAPGWRFVGWMGACSGPECRRVMFEDLEVTAVFEPFDENVPRACSALLPPALDEGVPVTLPQGPCRLGTSDKTGRFALGYSTGGGPIFPALQFFEPRGAEAAKVGENVYGPDDGPFEVFAQPEGFSLYRGVGPEGGSLSRYTTDGVSLLTEMVTLSTGTNGGIGTAITPDLAGGMVVTRGYHQAHPSGAALVSTFQRYGTSGAPASEEIEIARDLGTIAVGVSARGNVLVLARTPPPVRYQARWLSLSGAPITGWFAVGANDPQRFGEALSAQMEPLVDGGLVLRLRTRFHAENVLLFEEASPGTQTLPTWLSDRPVGRLFPIRGGTGYAVTLGSPCGDMIEVLTPEGASCGCVHAESLGPDTTVGLDGSLIAPHSDDAGQCEYRLYPGVFR